MLSARSLRIIVAFSPDHGSLHVQLHTSRSVFSEVHVFKTCLWKLITSNYFLFTQTIRMQLERGGAQYLLANLPPDKSQGISSAHREGKM